jgi:2-succinyl-6-hydroxy-2,4-cyclohexadiene-1-carboxylate synthase
LRALTLPVTVVVGGRDTKFMAYAERYREVLPQAEMIVVEGAGHGLPREAPRELAAAIDGRVAA